MGEAKPTPGECRYTPRAVDESGNWASRIPFAIEIAVGAAVIPVADVCAQPQAEANAALITEAFNVHNTTGLTSSQLVEQRDGLAGLLSEIYEMVRQGALPNDGDEWFELTSAALSKARPNTAEGEAHGKAPAGAEPELCPYCNGSGDTVVMDSAGPDAHEVPANCPHCKGSGLLADAYQGVVDLLKKKEREYLDCCARLYVQPRTPTTEQAAPAAANEPSP